MKDTRKGGGGVGWGGCINLSMTARPYSQLANMERIRLGRPVLEKPSEKSPGGPTVEFQTVRQSRIFDAF